MRFVSVTGMVEQIKDIDYGKLGARVRARRKELDMTQEELIALTGTSTSHISNIENGKTKVSLELVFQLANALNTSFDYLLYDQYEHPVGVLEHIILRDLRELPAEQQQIVAQLVHSMVLNQTGK